MIIDLHAHTYPLSDDSDLSPDELIDKAKRSGLDGICLTEHDWHWKEADIADLSHKHDFPVFHGMEVSSEEGHLLVFGLDGYTFGLHHARFVRKLVDEAGGFIILAHPYRRRVRYNPDPLKLMDTVSKARLLGLVDAVEVLNGRSRDAENDFARELSRRLHLKGIGGSDAHSLLDIPSYATEFERSIRTTREFIAELREGRYRPVNLRSSTTVE